MPKFVLDESEYLKEKERVDKLLNSNQDIYSNQLPFMMDAWELDYDIYILRNGKEINIKDLTNKELRNAHNIYNLYRANAFE